MVYTYVYGAESFDHQPHLLIGSSLCVITRMTPDGQGGYEVTYRKQDGTEYTRNLDAHNYVYYPDHSPRGEQPSPAPKEATR